MKMKQKNTTQKTKKQNNGITLIALVISIIVLLILAGVTVATLTGDNELLTKAGEAKNTSKVAEIMERIQVSVISSKTNNLGKLIRDDLEENLTKEFEENNYEIIPVGKGYIILVDNVQYKIEEDGNVINYGEISENNIENAGDLSKGGQYDGTTEETAYRIICIEDLVKWTDNYQTYNNKYIKLENTIDFENISNYNDYKKITSDINGNGTKEALITELTTGKGFKPISSFSGTFDGQNNEIRNIYENTTGDAGLIKNTGSNITVVIKNLGITGNITGNSKVGGMIASPTGQTSTANFINCYNKCEIKANSSAGGIVGHSSGSYQSNIKLIKCHNEGKISGNYAGGLIGGGHAYNFKVYNCYNNGNVNGTSGAGGILGSAQWPETLVLTVYNSFNRGKIQSNYAGGIGGVTNINPNNIFNTGEIVSLSNMEPAGIVGRLSNNSATFNTSYYLNNVTIAAYDKFNSKKTGLGPYIKEQMQSQEFVNTLNSYVDTYNEEHKNDEGFISLTRWKYNEGDYPTFE